MPSGEVVPGAGIEPARPQWPADFKSAASTNFAIRALFPRLFYTCCCRRQRVANRDRNPNQRVFREFAGQHRECRTASQSHPEM